MPLLFCVSIRPQAGITVILEKSRRCLLCRRTPDLSNQLAAALPSHKSLRLCLKAVHLLLRGCVAVGECVCEQVGIYLCSRAFRGSGRLQKICDLWLSACRHLCSQRCNSLTLSVTMKVIFKVERGDKQTWQAARYVISTNRGSITAPEGGGNTHTYTFE